MRRLMQIQPKDVRDMNGTLVLLSIVLNMPYVVWMAKIVTTNEIDRIPSWILLGVMATNFISGFSIVGLVRARLKKKMYARRAAETAGAGNKEG